MERKVLLRCRCAHCKTVLSPHRPHADLSPFALNGEWQNPEDIVPQAKAFEQPPVCVTPMRAPRNQNRTGTRTRSMLSITAPLRVHKSVRCHHVGRCPESTCGFCLLMINLLHLRRATVGRTKKQPTACTRPFAWTRPSSAAKTDTLALAARPAQVAQRSHARSMVTAKGVSVCNVLCC